MIRQRAAVVVVLALAALPRPAGAVESPVAAATYAEGVGFSNGGGGAHRLRGVGVDFVSIMEDLWVVVGAQTLAPATEAGRADMTAASLRWGIGAGEQPAAESHGIDYLMGFIELTSNLLQVTLGNETRNGLGAGLRLGVYGLLPPKGVLYYRIAAQASGGHLMTHDDAYALISGEISLGLLLAP